MFKQTLIAVSLVALAAPSLASTITTNPAAGAVMTTQALTSAATATAASFVITTAAAMDGGNTIQVTYSAVPTNPAAISATIGSCGTAPAVNYAGVTSAGKVLNYSVQNDEDELPIGCELTFGLDATKHPTFSKADIVAAAITATASFTIVGTGVDPVAAAKPIISMLGKEQYGLETFAAADAIVDVNAGRKAYVTGDSDTITLKHKDFGVGIGGATTTKSIITVSGNFAWADDPLTEAFDVGERNGQTPITVTGYGIGDGTNAPVPTSTTLSVYKLNPAADDDATIVMAPLTDAGEGETLVVATSLPNEAFTATNTVSFNDLAADPKPGSQAVAAISAGAWGLNGASVKVFAVPFGPEVTAHNIFVSNKGASTGALSASVAFNGNAAITVDLGNVEANANRYINLIDAMIKAGNKPTFGRADVTFTVNAPAKDITFTAGYTTDIGRTNLFMVEQANISTISDAAKSQAAAGAVDAAASEVLGICIKAALKGGVEAGTVQVLDGVAIAAGGYKFEC